MTTYQRPAKFAKWMRLCKPATKELAECVEEIVIQPLIGAGFGVSKNEPGDRDYPVNGREIYLERRREREIEAICFSFDKYRAPLFSLALEVWSEEATPQLLRWANVVRSQRVYWHPWGRRWWRLGWFWSRNSARKMATRLEAMIPQWDRFLHNGERGRNISKYVEPVRLAGQAVEPQ